MDLRERLRLALQPGAAPSPGPIGVSPAGPRDPQFPRSPADTPLSLPVQRVETGRGAIYLAEDWWPLDHYHGRLPLGDALVLEAAALARLSPGLDARDLAGAAFVDVETTGLAGGTGTLVFLVGLGTYEEDSFRLRQFFLADLRGEKAMLAAIADALAGCRALVSFNGRQFDLPLLETRFTMSRLPLAARDLPHLDLLYPARRLYRRRLPSCRLAALEEALLGVEREDDVPGWAIPALYFGYVRKGEAEPLRAVFRHNALDILSLAGLLAHLGRLTGTEAPPDPDDCLAVAAWDESARRLPDAARLYAAALEGGAMGEGRLLALRRLASLYRRLGRWRDAASLWEEAATMAAPGARLEALIELAKLEEHRRRDYAAAESLTRRALSLLEVMALRGGEPTVSALRREALEHRLWRLRRRQSAGGGRAGSGRAACRTPLDRGTGKR